MDLQQPMSTDTSALGGNFSSTHTNAQQSSSSFLSDPLSLSHSNDVFNAKPSSSTFRSIQPVVRTRLYTPGQKGPFIVKIQELSVKIKPIQFSSYINDKYKSASMLKRSPGQLKITLGCRLEANDLVVNGRFKEYRVSIPADLVEIEGAFNIEDLCDLEDMKTLITNGKGGFKNSSLGLVNIIHAERITRVEPNDPLSRRIMTNTVKVVFEGQVLPSFVILEGLRIQIRPFHHKPMYCDNCQQFGHTSKYCRRKPKCVRCGAEHKTSNCQDESRNQDMCPYCLTSPSHGRLFCPYFKEVDEDFHYKQTLRRKGRYSQAVALARATNPAENQVPLVNDTNHFPTLHNRFGLLPDDPDPSQDQTKETQPSTSWKPANPYSTVLKHSQVHASRPRSASKRRRMEKSLSGQDSTRPPVENIVKTQSQVLPVHSNSNNPTIFAIKTAILVLLKQANVAANWVAIIEVLIDPLLQAILPQSSVTSDNFNRPVRAGCP